MIPISPRGREHEILSQRTIAPTVLSVEKLEAAVCNYHGCRFAVAFTSPQCATMAALNAVGVAKNDAVITTAMGPDYHYAALAGIGAIPAFSEINLNGNLNARSLAALVSRPVHTALIYHFEGIQASYTPLPDNITVIEDATASLAPLNVQSPTIWSMDALMPEGVSPTGFVLTCDSDIAEALLRYRNGGKKVGSKWNYDILFPGIDSGLCKFSAALALEQTALLETAHERRREHIAKLDAALSEHRLIDRIAKSPDDDLRTYPLLLTPALYCPKEDIYDAIRNCGIEVALCYKPAYKTTAYKNESIRLPVTEDFYKGLLQLPCHHRLNDEEVHQITKSVLKAIEAFGYRGCSF